MYEDEDLFEDEQEFHVERDVWNRVGGGDIDMGVGGVINLKKSGYTEKEKFKLIAAATMKLINDQEELFSNQEINHMLSLVEKIPNFENKNPSVFAVAYYVAIHSNFKDLTLNKPILKKMVYLSSLINDQLFTRVEEIDIIRYARMCLFFKIR